MEQLGYYNGAVGPLDQMSVPMNDRACFFGDGLFEVTYSRNHIPYSVEEHMDRLYASAAELGIRIQMPKSEFVTLICDLCKQVDAPEQWVYWQVSRGTEVRNYTPGADLSANLWVMIRPMAIKDSSIPMRAITLEDKRALYCHMKTLNVLPTVLSSAKVAEAGVDEGILHREGRVTECIHANLSILKDGVLYTAPADHFILAGVARGHLIKKAKAFGIPVREEAFTLAELMGADEVIVTSSGTLCRPICEIDGTPVGGKAPELLKCLREALTEDFLKATE